MSYINRAVEALLIKKYKSYKSIAVTGAKQVGKTRMTKELFPSVKRINLKNPNLLHAASSDPKGFIELLPIIQSNQLEPRRHYY